MMHLYRAQNDLTLRTRVLRIQRAAIPWTLPLTPLLHNPPVLFAAIWTRLSPLPCGNDLRDVLAVRAQKKKEKKNRWLESADSGHPVPPSMGSSITEVLRSASLSELAPLPTTTCGRRFAATVLAFCSNNLLTSACPPRPRERINSVLHQRQPRP